MSTVLAYTSPALGHLFPMTPLLLELRSRGHRVHVRTLAGQVDRMESLGLEASAMDARVEAIEHTDYQAGSARAALAGAVATFAARGEYDGPDLDRAIDELRPDVLIVDINSWGALVAAEASGLPFVTFSPYTPPIRSEGTPPFGPGFKPLPGLLGRVRDGLLRPLVMGAAEKIMKPRIAALREAKGLPPVGSADEFFRRAPLMVVTTAEPFEYHHADWGDDILMIGASALGAAGGGAGLAGHDRPPARAGDHVLGVPGRRGPRAHGTRGARRRACLRGRDHARGGPRRPGGPRQRTGRAVPAARPAPGARGRGRDARWHGRRRRRPSPTACRSAWCRSGGTRWRSHDAWRSAEAGPACRRPGSTPTGFVARCVRRWDAPREPGGWPRATAPRVASAPPRSAVEQRFLRAGAEFS